MSRSEMALLPCALPTASQVLTTDPKITITEPNIFNLLTDDAKQAVKHSAGSGVEIQFDSSTATGSSSTVRKRKRD